MRLEDLFVLRFTIGLFEYYDGARTLFKHLYRLSGISENKLYPFYILIYN